MDPSARHLATSFCFRFIWRQSEVLRGTCALSGSKGKFRKPRQYRSIGNLVTRLAEDKVTLYVRTAFLSSPGLSCGICLPFPSSPHTLKKICMLSSWATRIGVTVLHQRDCRWGFRVNMRFFRATETSEIGLTLDKWSASTLSHQPFVYIHPPPSLRYPSDARDRGPPRLPTAVRPFDSGSLLGMVTSPWRVSRNGRPAADEARLSLSGR